MNSESFLNNHIEKESDEIYNKKYKKILKNPIGSGTYGTVFLVKNILNKKR